MPEALENDFFDSMVTMAGEAYSALKVHLIVNRSKLVECFGRARKSEGIG